MTGAAEHAATSARGAIPDGNRARNRVVTSRPSAPEALRHIDRCPDAPHGRQSSEHEEQRTHIVLIRSGVKTAVKALPPSSPAKNLFIASGCLLRSITAPDRARSPTRRSSACDWRSSHQPSR